MKLNTLIFGTLFMLSQCAFAQTFVKGDKCIMFGVNGVNGISQKISPVGSILYKKYKTDKLIKRIGINFTSRETVVNAQDQYILYEIDRVNDENLYTKVSNKSKYRQESYGFSYGYQYRIFSKNKFETYACWDMGISIEFVSNGNQMEYSESISRSLYYNPYERVSNVKPGDYDRNSNSKLGLSLLPQIGIGFNYYITDFISFGVELNYSVKYTNFLLKNTSNTIRQNGIDYPNRFGSPAQNLEDYEYSANNFGALITCQFLLKRTEKNSEVNEKQ